MKIRHGFVSNSSSSSFVVIGKGDLEMEGRHKGEVWDSSDFGETEFGWQNERYDDVHSKVNFAVIQAQYLDETEPDLSEEWLNMIREVIMEHTGATGVVFFDRVVEEYEHDGETHQYIDFKDDDVYIDHQSASYEDQNCSMFQDKDTLKRFLFSRHSYIQCGNDNE